MLLIHYIYNITSHPIPSHPVPFVSGQTDYLRFSSRFRFPFPFPRACVRCVATHIWYDAPLVPIGTCHFGYCDLVCTTVLPYSYCLGSWFLPTLFSLLPHPSMPPGLRLRPPPPHPSLSTSIFTGRSCLPSHSHGSSNSSNFFLGPLGTRTRTLMSASALLCSAPESKSKSKSKSLPPPAKSQGQVKDRTVHTRIRQRHRRRVHIAKVSPHGRHDRDRDGPEAPENHAEEDGGFVVGGPAEVFEGVGEEGEVLGRHFVFCCPFSFLFDDGCFGFSSLVLNWWLAGWLFCFVDQTRLGAKAR